MAIDVFRNGMNDKVGAVLQRILDIGAHEGVIDNHQDSMAVGDIRNLGDIDHPKCRVRRGLNPNQFGVARTDQLLHIQLNAGRESDLDAMGRSNFGEIPVCATIHIGDGYDVRAGG